MNGWKRLTQYLYHMAEDQPVEQDKIEKVKRVVDDLSEADKTIILKRYGIGQDRQYTLAELAAEIGTNREAVRKKEAHIFQTLQRQVKRL